MTSRIRTSAIAIITTAWFAGCGGADLDRTGTVDAIDPAFMEAAQGCRCARAAD